MIKKILFVSPKDSVEMELPEFLYKAIQPYLKYIKLKTVKNSIRGMSSKIIILDELKANE